MLRKTASNDGQLTCYGKLKQRKRAGEDCVRMCTVCVSRCLYVCVLVCLCVYCHSNILFCNTIAVGKGVSSSL